MARPCLFVLVPLCVVLPAACRGNGGGPVGKGSPTPRMGVQMVGVPAGAKQVFKDAAGRTLTQEQVAEWMMDGNHTVRPGRGSGDVHEFVIRERTAAELRLAIEQELRRETEITPREAPDPGFTDITGNTVARDALRGKVVVLNFWFPACKPCVAEIPELNRLAERYAPRGVIFVAPSRDDETKVAPFLATHRFAFRVCPAAAGLIRRFEVEAYPTNVVIDREGMMIMRAKGLTPATAARLERAIAKALGDPPPAILPPG